jgi:hypothetical protein
MITRDKSPENDRGHDATLLVQFALALVKS